MIRTSTRSKIGSLESEMNVDRATIDVVRLKRERGKKGMKDSKVMVVI